MATIFNSDLETETSAFETEWDSKTEEGSNTLAISTTAAHVHTGTNGAICTFDGTNNGVYAVKTVSDQSEVYTRQYIKFNSAFTVETDYQILVPIELKDGAQYLARVGAKVQADSQTFKWYTQYWNGSGNTAPAITAENIVLNTWYLVELHWLAGSGADGGIEVKIDGVSISSDFSGAQSAARCDTIRVGATAIGNAVPTADSELYFDDFASDDTSWVGSTSAGVDITPAVLTSSITAYNPTVVAGIQWDMGPFVYVGEETGVSVVPQLLQTTIQIHDPVVYAVDVPTAVAPPLLQTSIKMFNPTVNVGKFRNRIASMLHLIMGR